MNNNEKPSPQKRKKISPRHNYNVHKESQNRDQPPLPPPLEIPTHNTKPTTRLAHPLMPPALAS